MIRKRIAILFIHFLFVATVYAQPDFLQTIESNGQVFFRDASQPQVFYYLPGELEIAKNAEGRPDMQFIMMRYTNTGIMAGEPASARHRNILSMRIVMKSPSPDIWPAAKADLATRFGRNTTIKPLAVSKLDAMIVFIPVGNTTADTVVVRTGDMAAENNGAYTSQGAYWQERHFTLFPDNHSAMLLQEAFNKNMVAVSFTYAFHAHGITEKRILDISGFGSLQEKIKKQYNNAPPDTGAATMRECMVRSGAWAISPDLATYPDIIRKIDINEELPPGYAILNIRNYDFANSLRSDLYEKTVELEATGAGGGLVALHMSFRASQPDITSANFRFRYAVRPDKPYRYRIIELLKNGQENISEWKTISAWSQVLDITSRPDTLSTQ